jgi:hypothetical protein
MAVVWDFDIEAGDLTEFAGQASNDISASTSAALAGTTYGMAVVVNDTTDNYVYPTTLNPVNTTGTWRGRFYLDPNSVSMGDSDAMTVYVLRGGGNNLIILTLLYSSGYTIAATIVSDAGTPTTTAEHAITDAPHYIEYKLVRATNSTSADGSLQLWIDGVSEETITGIDNYDREASINSCRFGAFTTKTATTSGTFFIDQCVLNDDGGLIGPKLFAMAGAAAGVAAGEATLEDLPAGDALAGAAAGIATQSGTLLGTGALAGASAGTSTVVLKAPYITAALALFGADIISYLPLNDASLSGSAAGITTQSGTLLGAGALQGAVAASATQTGAVTGAGALNGASAGVGAASGAAWGAGVLIGASAGAASVSGLTLGAGALAGQAAGSSSAQLSSTGAIVYTIGESFGEATASATLLGVGGLIGDSTASATQSATLLGAGALLGTVSGTSTAQLYYGYFYASGTRTLYASQQRVTEKAGTHGDIHAEQRQSINSRD